MIRKIGVSERRLLDALKRAIAKHCAATGDTEQDIADEIGISKPYLNGMLNGTASFRLDVLLKTLTLTDLDYFGIELARIRRAVWQQRKKGEDINTTVGDMLREFGDVIRLVPGSGPVTPETKAEIITQIDEAAEQLACLRAQYETTEGQC